MMTQFVRDEKSKPVHTSTNLCLLAPLSRATIVIVRARIDPRERSDMDVRPAHSHGDGLPPPSCPQPGRSSSQTRKEEKPFASGQTDVVRRRGPLPHGCA